MSLEKILDEMVTQRVGAEVVAEMVRARELHGARTEAPCVPNAFYLGIGCFILSEAARHIEEADQRAEHIAWVDVVMEEVGEVLMTKTTAKRAVKLTAIASLVQGWIRALDDVVLCPERADRHLWTSVTYARGFSPSMTWGHIGHFIETTARGMMAAGDPGWANIFMDEVGEALRAEEPTKLRAELLQVAATALAWARVCMAQLGDQGVEPMKVGPEDLEVFMRYIVEAHRPQPEDEPDTDGDTMRFMADRMQGEEERDAVDTVKTALHRGMKDRLER